MEYIPSWAFKIYCKIWLTLADQNFTYSDLNKQDIYKVKKDEFINFIYCAKKKGWILVKLDELDGRKRVYKLMPLNTIVESFALD
mgnify:FL=1